MEKQRDCGPVQVRSPVPVYEEEAYSEEGLTMFRTSGSPIWMTRVVRENSAKDTTMNTDWVAACRGTAADVMDTDTKNDGQLISLMHEMDGDLMTQMMDTLSPQTMTSTTTCSTTPSGMFDIGPTSATTADDPPLYDLLDLDLDESLTNVQTNLNGDSGLLDGDLDNFMDLSQYLFEDTLPDTNDDIAESCLKTDLPEHCTTTGDSLVTDVSFIDVHVNRNDVNVNCNDDNANRDDVNIVNVANDYDKVCVDHDYVCTPNSTVNDCTYVDTVVHNDIPNDIPNDNNVIYNHDISDITTGVGFHTDNFGTLNLPDIFAGLENGGVGSGVKPENVPVFAGLENGGVGTGVKQENVPSCVLDGDVLKTVINVSDIGAVLSLDEGVGLDNGVDTGLGFDLGLGDVDLVESLGLGSPVGSVASPNSAILPEENTVVKFDFENVGCGSGDVLVRNSNVMVGGGVGVVSKKSTGRSLLKNKKSVESTIVVEHVISPPSPVKQSYREKRDKNNVASKNSREVRKRKYVDMDAEGDELEKENEALRKKIVVLEKMATDMKAQLIRVVAANAAK